MTLTQAEYAAAVASFSVDLHSLTESLSNIQLYTQLPVGSPVGRMPPVVHDRIILNGLRLFIERIEEFHAAAEAIKILAGELAPEDSECLIRLDAAFDRVLTRAMEVLGISPTLN